MCVSAASSCGNIALSSNVLPMMQNLKEGELCRIEIILCLHVICLKYMMQFKKDVEACSVTTPRASSWNKVMLILIIMTVEQSHYTVVKKVMNYYVAYFIVNTKFCLSARHA